MYRIYFDVEDCFSEMADFVVFFEQQFYFLETAANTAVLGFADIVAGVGDDVANGPDIVGVAVGCDFLSTERVLGIWPDKYFVRDFCVSTNDSIVVPFDFISFCNNVIFFFELQFDCFRVLYSGDLRERFYRTRKRLILEVNVES